MSCSSTSRCRSCLQLTDDEQEEKKIEVVPFEPGEGSGDKNELKVCAGEVQGCAARCFLRGVVVGAH